VRLYRHANFQRNPESLNHKDLYSYLKTKILEEFFLDESGATEVTDRPMVSSAKMMLMMSTFQK
jgi:hypothetical protein